jgi:hypothetical protein
MPVRAQDVLLRESASKAIEALQKREAADPAARSVLRRARALRAILLADALHGKVVRKPLPAALVEKHGIDNLYVEDLPSFWRLLYSVARLELKVFVVVVEIVDHGAYDHWFPGRGR